MRSFIAAVALVAAVPAAAKECRMPDVPPGVRAQLPPGCDRFDKAAAAKASEQSAARGEAGFIDLGNGTKVRIGGRVRAEMGVTR
jgi:hypothetical protein